MNYRLMMVTKYQKIRIHEMAMKHLPLCHLPRWLDWVIWTRKVFCWKSEREEFWDTSKTLGEIGPQCMEGEPKKSGLYKSVYQELRREQGLKDSRSRYFPIVNRLNEFFQMASWWHKEYGFGRTRCGIRESKHSFFPTRIIVSKSEQ
jgi:hypothetical protein